MMKSAKTFEFTMNGGEIAIVEGMHQLSPIASHARLRVRVGVDTGTLTHAIHAAIDLLTSRCIVRLPACISDVDARLDKTVEAGRVLVEARAAQPPTQRSTATGRQRIADGQRKRWAAYRERACHGN